MPLQTTLLFCGNGKEGFCLEKACRNEGRFSFPYSFFLSFFLSFFPLSSSSHQVFCPNAASKKKKERRGKEWKEKLAIFPPDDSSSLRVFREYFFSFFRELLCRAVDICIHGQTGKKGKFRKNMFCNVLSQKRFSNKPPFNTLDTVK